MKGAIFNIFETFIADNFGDATYECIYAAALPKMQTKCPFVGPGSYPDADFMALVQHTVDELNISVEDATKAFGNFAFSKLADSAPDFVKPYNHPKPFLKTIDSVIHVEVRKMYPDAMLPKFWYQDTGADTLTLCYQSPRKLYYFVDGMIHAVCDHFQVETSLSWAIKDEGNGEFAEYHITFSRPE